MYEICIYMVKPNGECEICMRYVYVVKPNG
ncbi:hypothetical protein F383_20711 [Gossypium arboreum]|uniref:Uncharacterized protein n=1 Tax=Gossypium arboreum TaxID=29729 RepID=A0A0B0NUU3_GOSAR|nr:hypothetical protein F383_20711 [Gossypium arboreum]